MNLATTYTDEQLEAMTRSQLRQLADESYARHEELSAVLMSQRPDPDRHADDVQRVLEEARRFETFAAMK